MNRALRFFEHQKISNNSKQVCYNSDLSMLRWQTALSFDRNSNIKISKQICYNSDLCLLRWQTDLSFDRYYNIMTNNYDINSEEYISH